jgi:hypothetical protein
MIAIYNRIYIIKRSIFLTKIAIAVQNGRIIAPKSYLPLFIYGGCHYAARLNIKKN